MNDIILARVLDEMEVVKILRGITSLGGVKVDRDDLVRKLRSIGANEMSEIRDLALVTSYLPHENDRSLGYADRTLEYLTITERGSAFLRALDEVLASAT